MSELDHFLDGLGDMLTKEQRAELEEAERLLFGQPFNDALAKLVGMSVRFALLNNGILPPSTRQIAKEGDLVVSR